MEHADKFIDRIIFLDGFPNMQVLDPLHIGQNVKEILDCDLHGRNSARSSTRKPQRTATAVQATTCTRDLFEKLMHDEEHHIDFLETQLDLVEQARRRALLAASHRRDGRGAIDSRLCFRTAILVGREFFAPFDFRR